jgi:hypothetical protein
MIGGTISEDILLNFRIDRHDRTQLELKLDYGLQAGVAKQNYHLETFIFVPKVLAMTAKTYTADRFYADTASFIRMTTPKVPLSELSRKSAVRPWASDIKEQIDRFSRGEPADVDAAEQGLKLLACVFKAAVKNEHIAVRTAIIGAINDEQWKQAGKKLSRFTDDIETALRRLTKVGDQSNKPGVPVVLKEGWAAVDEYASLLAEEALTDLVALADVEQQSRRLEKALDRARDVAVAQYHHRRAQGCMSYAHKGERNEHLPHRWRILKRYVSSALYLDVTRDQSGQVATELAGMAAAALAMLFATVAILVIQQLWAASLSAAFLSAMVLSYVVKDRVKDLGKRHIGRHLRKTMSDHIIRVRGHDGTEIGQVKESFRVREVRQLPKEIQALRYAHLGSQIAIEGRPETVLCYRKDITLSSASLTAQFAKAEGLTDVVRLNLQPMLAHMDDGRETYRYIHPITRKVEETECARVYHINVVLHFVNGIGATHTHLIRAILNKTGILRVEFADQPAEDGHNGNGGSTGVAKIRIFDD